MKQCMFTKWSFYGASKIILLYNLNLYSPVCQLDLNTTRRTKSKENIQKINPILFPYTFRKDHCTHKDLYLGVFHRVNPGRMSSLMWYKTEMSNKEQQGEPWTGKKSSRNTSSKSAQKTVNQLLSRIHREIGKNSGFPL